MKYYAGIGSRQTPKDILILFEKLGTYLANQGYILRSGHADGADKAFEQGCDKVNGQKEIWLPWQGFNGSDSNYIVSSQKAFEIAKEHHPYWYNLKQGGQKLQARNSHQVLGEDLNTPSDFIICWTKNGKGSGGTGQSIRLSKIYHIPVFDCGLYDNMNEMKLKIKEFFNELNVI